MSLHSLPVHSASDLFGQRAFMRMWLARLFATTGNQMLMVAAGWQMYELTGSAWDLGLVGLYQFVPAQQALTPMLVPSAMLPRAMAFSSAGMQAAVIGGPALGA